MQKNIKMGTLQKYKKQNKLLPKIAVITEEIIRNYAEFGERKEKETNLENGELKKAKTTDENKVI